MEIGVFEGRRTVWLLENILTHPASTLTYVDTFAGGAEHAATDLTDLEARLRANTEPHRAKLVARKGPSAVTLRELSMGRYDFVSIDGSHEAADVLSDAVLSWPLVKPGGLVCFDDYEWWIDAAPERSPKLAIDAFLATMRGALRGRAEGVASVGAQHSLNENISARAGEVANGVAAPMHDGHNGTPKLFDAGMTLGIQHAGEICG